MKTLNKRTWSALVTTGLLSSIAALSGGCESGPYTYYYDYLKANGTITQANGQALAGARVDFYDWIVSYTDGSTVAVPFEPGVTTDVNGKFAFDSSALALQSGNLAESCTDVCIATATEYEDVCVEWSTDYGNEYCVDWEYDEYGNEYCADWEYEETTYCSDWDTVAYEYCTAWGEDCEYYYPARDISDITQAYSEIGMNFGGSTVITASLANNYPGTSVQTVSTLNETSGNTTVDTFWNQTDTYSTPIIVGVSAKRTLTANQAKITAERNAAKIKARKMKRSLPAGVTAPRARKLRKDAKKTPVAQLMSDINAMAKIEKARIGCGAEKKAK